ncbi:MAG: aminotransferase class V-fold PLP-dependent enzyme [Firmicutes bacterium]|nr:aminotransferase class V-fold PLP-dependent enzyme [Bacillota bacterium]
MSTTASADRLTVIRQALPALQHGIYLNTGTAGPLPEAAYNTLVAESRREYEEGRSSPKAFVAFGEVLAQLRQRLAQLLHATPEEIALTHNTTEGINILLWGLRWLPGDEVVTSSLEHEGVLLPLYQLHHRNGTVIRFADVGNGEQQQAVEAFSRAITPKTRLVVLSHVTYSTGACLPLAEITALAHRVGARVVVDAAQSAGAIDVDVRALDVDGYAFSGQKWLLGPEGTGGLFVRREWIPEIEPTYVGYFSMNHAGYRTDDPHTFTPAQGAARYEGSSVFRPGLQALLADLDWLIETVGLGWVYTRVAEMATYAKQQLQRLPQVKLLTPPNAAGLVNFLLEGVDSVQVVQALHEAGVVIRSIPDNGALRLSCGFFNTTEEVDKTVQLLGDLAAALHSA